MQTMLKLAAVACVVTALAPIRASHAGEFVGVDPYGRHIYAPSGPIPIVPSRIRGPEYQRNPGPWAGATVAGPLYYAEPAPVVSGFYRADPTVEAGAVLAFDVDDALGAASLAEGRDARCAARYRSYDPISGTYLARGGVRRTCG